MLVDRNAGRFIALGHFVYEVFMERYPAVKDRLINKFKGITCCMRLSFFISMKLLVEEKNNRKITLFILIS